MDVSLPPTLEKGGHPHLLLCLLLHFHSLLPLLKLSAWFRRSPDEILSAQPYLVEEGGRVSEDPILPHPTRTRARRSSSSVRVTKDGCTARCDALLHNLEIGKRTTTSSKF
jgi:hypothetical protein